MTKVIIIGNGGTGKSTLGEKLGKMLNLPVTHLDQITWKPGWLREDENVFREKLANILSTDRWVVEGWSFHTTVKMRLDAADTIIYLEYPYWFALIYAWKRHITYAFRPNPYDPPNSPILKKTRRMFQAIKLVHEKFEPELREMLKEYEGKKNIYRFKSRKELNVFLKSLEN